MDRVFGHPRAAPVALAALVLFVLAWHLWALLADQRLTGCDADTLLHDTLLLLDRAGQGRTLETLLGWPSHRGPVGPALAALLTAITGDVVLGCRLLAALAHGLMLWQLYCLGRHLGQGVWGRLWAPLYLALTPLVYGWARLEFPEPLLAVWVLAALQLTLEVRLERPWRAALLGLVWGLGLMTKLSFLVFMVVPGMWLVLRRLRSLRSAALLLLALGLLAAVSAPWLWTSLPAILNNFQQSSHGPELARVVLWQILAPPHTVWLVVLAGAGALLLWWRRGIDRWAVALLLLLPLASGLMFVFRFHYWTRYLLPAYPPLALLAGAVAAWAARRLPRPVAVLAGAALVGGLLVSFVIGNLALPAVHGINREYEHGMLAPDREAYQGYATATLPFRTARVPVLELILPGHAHTRWIGMSRIWRRRGVTVRPLDHRHLARKGYAGQTVGVVVVGRAPPGSAPGIHERRCPPWHHQLPQNPTLPPAARAELGRRWPRCLVFVVEPDLLAFAAYALAPGHH